MHDARAIANFFIDRAVEKSRPVTSMTLLKVLYFAHAWHLAKFERPLVAQPFEAWRNGPVNRVVYDQIKVFGSKAVVRRLQSFDAKVGNFSETEYNLDEVTTIFLSNIFDFYSHFHPFRLSDLTHEAGSPWEEVWSAAENKAVPGMIISNDRIRMWFLQSGAEHLRSAKQRYAI